MQFLDSATNFVFSCLGFIGFCLFEIFIVYCSGTTKQQGLFVSSLICDYLELFFEGKEEYIEFCKVLVLYHGLPMD